ncbi:Cas10/Cmr2 second palm domain-containing protein [Laspinema olomoucense]|uniref:Cas10/Cmr2 second palm domain-containing protein n=1 Tax=Laspinema olomoucense TaxID=3231600 RepID=UPI0021BABC93|nr:type III-B CRISPR-associated protein Cas10/Cmr2 [Laspinema sp. D3c]MCT7992436.1 hypothetical protein [Laspinema sp. D3c]
MDLEDWLAQQKSLYSGPLPEGFPSLAVHPTSGTWQESSYLKNQFWWGGGATQEGWQQITRASKKQSTNIAVLTFGPVQNFLGGGQRLRDWAVASWLCHYLAAVVIYRWETEYEGRVLFPLHDSSDLLNWLHGKTVDYEKFWRAELPNVVTGLYTERKNWIKEIETLVQDEWVRFTKKLEQVTINHPNFKNLINGPGWQVIHRDAHYQWSVYVESIELRTERVTEDIKKLHKRIDADKLSRNWEKSWWGGRTSPSDGCLSIWHPGLKPIDCGGTSGLPKAEVDRWWKTLASSDNLDKFYALFSESDRLNSLELVKRLASIPEIIQPTLAELWPDRPPLYSCPWGTFPDRPAIAATWVTTHPEVKSRWNQTLLQLEKDFFPENARMKWGVEIADRSQFRHPDPLERRNIIDKELVSLWDEESPKGWDSTIEWTVGWRGDGDNMGKWLSGEKYKTLSALRWLNWHPNTDIITKQKLKIAQPTDPKNLPKKIELPHMLDLSALFGHWNALLYRLTEQEHPGKVIFAGGDDFLLLGPLTEAISLTTNLHNLWLGEHTPFTEPTQPPADGWVQYDNEVYPVPGRQMSFSLGLVIAQRRVPQSVLHRRLNESYKQAKNQGRNRVCVRVLFNSGQSLDWVCPWPLWHVLMPLKLQGLQETELNRWEKLLSYLESIQLRQKSLDNLIQSSSAVQSLLDTLWHSLGIPLRWQDVKGQMQRDFNKEVFQWDWWVQWASFHTFLARQERDRQNWLKKMTRR